MINRVDVRTPFKTLLDISNDPRHVLLAPGRAGGLWLDNTPHPIRLSSGAPALFPAAQNAYRFIVDSWDDGNGWLSTEAPVFVSPNAAAEQHYGMSYWPFGMWGEGEKITAIAHAEWYKNQLWEDGQAFNATQHHYETRATAWMQSDDDGNAGSWQIKPIDPTIGSQGHRLFRVPEPWTKYQYKTGFGDKHPSNWMKEGDYFYTAVDTATLKPDGLVTPTGDQLISVGVALLRIKDLDHNDPLQTEFFIGNGQWTKRRWGTYQDNNAPADQHAHLMWRVDNYNPFTTSARNNRMGQCIRKLQGGGFSMWGYTGMVAPYLCVTYSETLADPKFETNPRIMARLNGLSVGGDYIGNSYLSVFDPTCDDQNYTTIGSNPVCLVVDDYVRWRIQELELS